MTAADMAFHDAVLRASGNPFVPVLLGRLAQLLYAERRNTSAFPEVQRHAIRHHRLVLAAIASRDPAAARTAMEDHLDQTAEDYEHYIGLPAGTTPGADHPTPPDDHRSENHHTENHRTGDD